MRLPHKALYMSALGEYIHSLLTREGQLPPTIGEVNANAEQLYKVMRAMVRASVPGRQQKKNLDELMRAALTAGRRYLKPASQAATRRESRATRATRLARR